MAADSARPVLSTEALQVRLGGAPLPVLRDLSLALAAGEIVGVCGVSGGGKTTLVAALSGLVPWARPAQVVGATRLGDDELSDLDPSQRSYLLGTCLDRPETQLFLATPRQEIESAARLHRGAPLHAKLVNAFALTPLLNRRITELSSGERQRVALAATLAAVPRPVLLDEPTAHLDAAGVAALATVLREVRKLGGAALVVEHAGWRLGDAVDRWLELRSGVLSPVPVPTPPPFLSPRPAREKIVLQADGVSVTRAGHRLVAEASLLLHAGEIVLLSGPNGAGKSSLARALAGCSAGSAGGLKMTGTVRAAGRVAIMLADTELQLFAGTVADEVALTGVDERGAARSLRRHGLEAHAGRAPWTLSRGERQRLVHAALDVLSPRVLIVDEPAQGLDPEALANFAALLRRRAAHGRAYLIVSQREELAAAAHRVLWLEAGVLSEIGGAR